MFKFNKETVFCYRIDLNRIIQLLILNLRLFNVHNKNGQADLKLFPPIKISFNIKLKKYLNVLPIYVLLTNSGRDR